MEIVEALRDIRILLTIYFSGVVILLVFLVCFIEKIVKLLFEIILKLELMK